MSREQRIAEAKKRVLLMSKNRDEDGNKHYKHDYNLLLPAQLTSIELELFCFRVGWSKENGGLGKFEHCRKAINMIWPDTEWNAWLERQIRSLCVQAPGGYRTVSWAGCATAGKTYAAGLYAMIWWLADPTHSIAILTSTTKDMIRRRVWPVIQNLVHTAMDTQNHRRLTCGHLLESRTALQAVRGDDKHSIFALAVRDGETSKAVENIKGQHAPRILIVIDEATGTPEAIFQTLPNLRKSCQDFTLLCIGNPVSKRDCHGVVSTPKDGWDSITVEDEDWPTRGVSEWQVEPGRCYHFDGFKSPNVKAGNTIFPYIYTVEDHQSAIRNHDPNSIHVWSMDRGFWAPEGQLNTVLSPGLLERTRAEEPLDVVGDAIAIAGLDPAFGGDGCVLRFGRMGNLGGGKKGVHLIDSVSLNAQADTKEAVDFQLARQAQEHCVRRGVSPENFGCDATGVGRGIFAIISEEWSRSIVRVEFGGLPSDMPAGPDDGRSAADVYDRRVTELWFVIRQFVLAGLLGGLNKDEVAQLCSREYTIKSRKIAIETKKECKAKLGRSPDDADALAVLIDVARRRGALPRYGNASGQRNWRRFVERANSVYDDDAPVFGESALGVFA